ncbi:ribose 5-phosphate isomerase B [Candidatus Woesearchaeota archaeon]|nr:ribose 5-phosphate isomerase B [Candidatus Woesearchaeota archaeon]
MDNIMIGSDHAGFELKESIISFLKQLGYNPEDMGAYSKDSVDYPLIAKKVAQKVAKTSSIGILICGTGIGMSIASNKIKGIRAALCYDESCAALAREHNNANILCLGARTPSAKSYKKIIKRFLTTPSSKEERHRRRVKEMDAL